MWQSTTFRSSVVTMQCVESETKVSCMLALVEDLQHNTRYKLTTAEGLYVNCAQSLFQPVQVSQHGYLPNEVAREPAASSGKKCLKSRQPRARARARAGARDRARTSLELG